MKKIKTKKIYIKNYSDAALIDYLNEQLKLGWVPNFFNQRYLYLEKRPAAYGQFFIDYSVHLRGSKPNHFEYLQFYRQQGFQFVAVFRNKYLFYTSDITASFPIFPDHEKWSYYFKNFTYKILLNFITFILSSYFFAITLQSKAFLFNWLSIGLLIYCLLYAILGLFNLISELHLSVKAKTAKDKQIDFERFAKSNLMRQPQLMTQFLLAYLIPMLPCLFFQIYYTGLNFNLSFYLGLALGFLVLLYGVLHGSFKVLKQKGILVLLLLPIIVIGLLHYLPKESQDIPLSETLPIVAYNEIYHQNPPSTLTEESVKKKPLPFLQDSIIYYSLSRTNGYAFYSYELSNTPFLIPLYYAHYQERIEDLVNFKEYYAIFEGLEGVYIYENLPARLIIMATHKSNFIYSELTVPHSLDSSTFINRISDHLSSLQME